MVSKGVKKALALVLAFSMVLSSSSINTASAKKSKIALNKKKLTLTVGKKAKLVLKGVTKKQKKKIKWQTNKKAIIKVSKTGYVRALKKGRAYAIAKLGKKKYKCLVTVKAKKQTVVTREPIGTTTNPSETVNPTETVNPSETINPSVNPTEEVSATPVVTEAPSESAFSSLSPAETKTPDATKTPGVTSAPKASATPEKTATPDVTQTPKTSATPEATTSPKESNTPEVSVTPITSASPENSDIPEVSESPVESELPTESAEPVPVLKGNITYDTGFWDSLLEKITFGKYEAEKTVKITSTGDECKIYYYIYNGSDALTETELSQYTFKEYTGEFKLSNGDSVVYAKFVSEKDPTIIKYISSDGITIEKEDAVVKSVNISPATASLKVGMTTKLNAVVTAEGEYTKGVDWSSSATGVATVDADGNVIAISAGKAVITATANGISGQATITVTDIYPTSLSLSKSEITLSKGGSDTITTTILPENASVKTITWTSTNNGVATVEGGVVKAVNAGTATITASVASENGFITRSTTVTVLEDTIKANSISIQNSKEKADLGTTLQLSCITEPLVITNPITWTSLNTDVATVNDAGLVSFISVGEAVIVASVDGKSDKVTIQVEKAKIYPTSIVLNQESSTVNVGESVVLSAILSPSNITEKTITWSSSDENIATVDNGTVTAKGKGSAVITASAKSSDNTIITDTFTINVNVPVESVSITNVPTGIINLYVDEDLSKAQFQLAVKVNPEDAGQTVTYTSSNNSGLSVSTTGLIRAFNTGTYKVTASAENKYAECTVNVYKRATGIELSEVSVLTGKSKAVPVTLLPKGETTDSISDITWSIDKPGIAHVEKNDAGEPIVTGIAAGTATLTAAINGTVSSTCKITVLEETHENHITSVELSDAEVNVNSTVALKWEETREDVNSPTTDTVTFETEDESIATVNQTGVITGIKEGQTTVRILAQGVTMSTAIITVKNPVVSVSSSVSTLSLAIGKKVDLKNYVSATLADGTSIAITEANLAKYGISFVTYSSGIISLSSTGVCEGIGSGQASVSFDTGKVYTTFSVKVSPIDASKVTITGNDITNKKLTLERDNTLKNTSSLSASVDENATYKGIKWSSANTDIVTIDSDGNVKAVGSGTTYIRATSEDGKAYDEITVTVEVRTLALDLTWTNNNTTKSSATHSDGNVIEETVCSDTVNTGATGTINVNKYHADSIDVIDTPLNSDTSVILINKESEGVYSYQAIREGTATVTFETSNNIKASITFTVKDIPISVINVTGDGLSNNKVTYDIKDGTDYKITATVNEDATDKTLNFSVETGKENILKVDNEGNIKVLNPGTAKITITGGSISKVITVTVLSSATAVTLPASLTIKKDEWTDLNATITPSNATYESIKWSTDTSVATLESSSGLTNRVKGVKSGASCTVTLTVTLHDGSTINGTCNITVENTVIAVAGVVIDGSALPKNIYPGDIVTGIKATVLPANATNKDVHWTVSDDTYATIDTSTGVITAKKAGTVSIYATAGGITSSAYTLTISKVPADSITLSTDKESIKPGDTFTVSRTILPSSSESDVIWSVEDSENCLLTYSENNDNNLVCTAKASGTVYITATADDEKKVSKYISIYIEPIKTEQITMNEDSISLKEGSVKTLSVKEILPSDASDKTVGYYMLDNMNNPENEGDTVATVNKDTGVVTALNPGTAVVRVITNDSEGKVYADVSIIVTALTVESLKLSNESVSVKSNASFTLSASISPINARDGKVTWEIESGKEAYLTLSNEESDSQGNSTATFTAGAVSSVTTVIVTATAGSKTASAVITINPITVNSITLDSTIINIVKGGTLGDKRTITAKVNPTDAVNKSLVWKIKTGSSYCKITSYDSYAVITATKTGSAVIYAQTEDGSVKSEECTVNISTASTGIKVTDASNETITSLSVDTGSVTNLYATVTPEGSLGYIKSFESSNTDVVKVSDDGKVTAVKSGSAIITIKADNGEGTEIKKTINVTVNKINVSAVVITGDGISSKTLSLNEGETSVVKAVVSPSTAENKNVRWESSNSAIVSIDDNTTVQPTLTALAAGTATITLISEDDNTIKDTITVTVSKTVKTVESISISGAPDDGNIYAGNTLTLNAVLTPSDATDKRIEWTSSDSTVASIEDTTDTSVKVTALTNGTVKITAKALGSSDGQESASVTLTVLGNIKLSKSSISLKEGNAEQLMATVTGLDESKLKWSVSSSYPRTSGNTVVTVDNTGLVTAVNPGTATISATIGNITAVCEVTVTSAVTSLSISPKNPTIEVGETVTLQVTAEGGDASVTWGLESKYTSIVSRTANANNTCTITGLKAGTAVVTAKLKDDTSITDSCTITVVNSTIPSESPEATATPTPVTGTMTLTASSSGKTKTIKSFEREGNITYASSDYSSDLGMILSDKITVSSNYDNGKAYYHIIKFEDLPYHYSSGTTTTYQYSIDESGKGSANYWPQSDIYTTISEIKEGTEATTRFVPVPEGGFTLPKVSGESAGYMVYIKLVDDKGFDSENACYLANGYPIYVYNDGEAPSPEPSHEAKTPEPAPEDEGESLESISQVTLDNTLSVGNMYATMGESYASLKSHNGTEVRHYLNAYGTYTYVYNPGDDYKNLLLVYIGDGEVVGFATISKYAKYTYGGKNVITTNKDIPSDFSILDTYHLETQYYTVLDDTYEVEAYVDKNGTGKVYGLRIYDTSATTMKEARLNSIVRQSKSYFSAFDYGSTDYNGNTIYHNDGLACEGGELVNAYRVFRGLEPMSIYLESNPYAAAAAGTLAENTSNVPSAAVTNNTAMIYNLGTGQISGGVHNMISPDECIDPITTMVTWVELSNMYTVLIGDYNYMSTGFGVNVDKLRSTEAHCDKSFTTVSFWKATTGDLA